MYIDMHGTFFYRQGREYPQIAYKFLYLEERWNCGVWQSDFIIGKRKGLIEEIC